MLGLTQFSKHHMDFINKVIAFCTSPFVGFIIGAAGIILSLYFYKISKKYRIPKYAVRNINLIEDSIGKIGDIKITYGENEVQNLSIAQVAFWNDGKETINSGDVAPLSPIVITANGKTNFLDLTIIYSKNDANNFRLEPIPNPVKPEEHLQNKLLIKFDYFDFNEGIIIQIFHTGTSSKEIQIEGAVKGCRSIKRMSKPIISKTKPIYEFLNKLKFRHKKIIAGVFLIAAPFIFYLSNVITRLASGGGIFKLSDSPFLLLALIYWGAAGSVLRRRIPSGFELFEEEIKPNQNV
jgi:hypothetical protein